MAPGEVKTHLVGTETKVEHTIKQDADHKGPSRSEVALESSGSKTSAQLRSGQTTEATGQELNTSYFEKDSIPNANNNTKGSGAAELTSSKLDTHNQLLVLSDAAVAGERLVCIPSEARNFNLDRSMLGQVPSEEQLWIRSKHRLQASKGPEGLIELGEEMTLKDFIADRLPNAAIIEARPTLSPMKFCIMIRIETPKGPTWDWKTLPSTSDEDGRWRSVRVISTFPNTRDSKGRWRSISYESSGSRILFAYDSDNGAGSYKPFQTNQSILEASENIEENYVTLRVHGDDGRIKTYTLAFSTAEQELRRKQLLNIKRKVERWLEGLEDGKQMRSGAIV